ncbi:MAG: hypothetical protein D6698_16710 [Gammaproteobacteria bacterium]|nr:MAG: hypothetical protein D6698_16710 [Gammaproteobacteria bacterium]
MPSKQEEETAMMAEWFDFAVKKKKLRKLAEQAIRDKRAHLSGKAHIPHMRRSDAHRLAKEGYKRGYHHILQNGGV